MNSRKFLSTIMFSISSFLYLSCAVPERFNSTTNQEPQKNESGEYRLTQDRKAFDDLRKDIPEEKRQTNDELALILSTIGTGEKKPSKARDEWQSILRKKRTKFNDSIQKQRDQFSQKEKSSRAEFLKKIESARKDFQKNKVSSEERSDFYQQIETQRREYFSEEQMKRSTFESDIREKRAEFEDYIQEKNNLFNDEVKSLEKREELRKKEDQNTH